MRIQNFIFIFLLSIIMSGCAGCETDTPINNSNINGTPQINNSTPSPSNGNETPVKTPEEEDPLGTTKTPPPKKINDADTLKPLIQAYCNAVKSQNDAELQKVYSRQAWASMQKYAKDEGFSSVAKFLNDGEPVGNTCNVINEKLSGNTGVAVVSTETYPNGIELKFVKEGNEWKMTTQSTEF